MLPEYLKVDFVMHFVHKLSHPSHFAILTALGGVNLCSLLKDSSLGIAYPLQTEYSLISLTYVQNIGMLVALGEKELGWVWTKICFGLADCLS